MLGVPTSSATKRILVVEDNELNMKLLNDVLEAHGYDVLSTGEGAVAVAWARQYRPDLILMDLQLPDISGLDVTRQLKADEDTASIPCRGHRFRDGGTKRKPWTTVATRMLLSRSIAKLSRSDRRVHR